MNIFKEMALSIYSYKSYKEFLKNKAFKVFGFGAVLMLIYWAVTVGAPFVKFWFGGPGFLKELDEAIPDFELSDGYLWVDDVFEYEEGDVYVNIDTDPDWVFYDVSEMWDFINEYSSVILMDSEKIIINNNGQIQQHYFYELGDLEFTKADLLRFIPYIYLWVIIVMVLAYFWMTALFFLGVCLVALLGMIVASCMKYRLSFGQLYQLGVYSRVLPLLIKALVSFLPFGIPFFWVINFGISLVIIGCAIQKMKEQDLPGPLQFSSGNGGNGYYNGGMYNGSDGGFHHGYNGGSYNNYGDSQRNGGYGNGGYGNGNYGGSDYNGGNGYYNGNYGNGQENGSQNGNPNGNYYDGNYGGRGNEGGGYPNGNYDGGSYDGNANGGNR